MPDTTKSIPDKKGEIKGLLLLLIRILAAIVFLLVIYILSLRLPIVQNWTKNQVLNYVNTTYQQNITINQFYFDPIEGFTAEIFIPDHHNDTLFYSDRLQIGLLKSLVTLYQRSLALKDIKINKLTSKIIKYPGEEQSNLNLFLNNFQSSGNSDPLHLNVKSVGIQSTRLLYKDETYDAEIQFDKFKVTIDSLNSVLNYYKIRKILIDNPRIDIFSISQEFTNHSQNLSSEEPHDSCKENFGIAVDFLNINNGSLNLIIEKGKSYKYYDFNTIFLSGFQMFLSRDLAQFDFLHFNAKSKDDLVLKNAVVNQFKLNKHILFFNKVKVETNKSNFELKCQINASDPYAGDFSNAFIRIEIAKSLIDPRDISFFIPHWNLNNFIRTKTELPFYLQGEIFGKEDNLRGKNISFKFEDNLSFQGNIQARNLFQYNRALINLKIEDLTTKASFIRKLLPNFNIPDTYDKFGNIKFKGNYDGYFHDFVAYGTFKTDLGLLYSDIKLKHSEKENLALYSGTFQTQNLKLGELLGNTDIGYINMQSKILNGKGLSKKNFHVNIESSISALEFKNYLYKDIQFNGTVNIDQFIGEIKIKDENIDLIINGAIGKIKNKYKININSNIAKLNLKPLKLSEDSISYSGVLDCKLEGNQEDNLEGYISSLNTKLTIKNTPYSINTFKITQTTSKNNRKLFLHSDFLISEIDGYFTFEALKHHISDYIAKKVPKFINIHKTNSNINVPEVNVKGFVYIKNGQLLSAIVNSPVIFDKADCDFYFDSENEILDVTSNRFDLAYNDYSLSKMSFTLNSSENIKFIFTTDYVLNDGIKLVGNFKYSTNFNEKNGQSLIQFFDSTNTKIISNVQSLFALSEDTLRFSILNKDLFINKSRWKINENNLIEITNNSYKVEHFEMTDNAHYISIRDNNKNGFIINTDGFDISFINQFIKNKTIAFYGLFSTELLIPDLKNINGSTAKINIFQLHFNQDNFGPFKLDISLKDLNEPWNIYIENIFQEHIIKGKGTINIPMKVKNYKYKPFDFYTDLQLTAFPMSFLDNFISGISNTTGTANGNLKFYSVDQDLILEGEVIIDESRFFIDYLGAPVFIKNQPVRFAENNILLNKITLLDSLGNTLLLNGNLNHNYLKDFSVDLRLTAQRAFLLNTKKTDNSSYYGQGIGSVDAKFNGLISTMDMQVNLNMQKGTKINIPVETSSSASDQQFVKFVNRNKVQSSNRLKELNSEAISGLNLYSQITFTDEAEIYIIFDEQAGDVLKGYGRGNLIIKSLRNGLFTVNGSYEIEEGQYLFTLYNFVNKPFTLKRGGLITWTGDPINADINLEAIYEGVNTSILPLITEYVSIEDRNELRQQRTEVKVRMILTGKLLQPTIKFDIDFPELTGNIKNFADTKLRFLRSNEDQLNQQIFGLLVLGSFINTNNSGSVIGNIQATGINTISEMLFNQASLFVSNILSNAFDDVDFISGIDFNIGYDLNRENLGAAGINDGEVVLSVKPRFWNDQLIVTFGGNIRSNSNTSLYGNSNFNPESVIEWNTPVKGLKLRVYYKGDESIEGIKHKIGTGINYRKEFDSFLDFEGELKQLAKDIKKNDNGKKIN